MTDAKRAGAGDADPLKGTAERLSDSTSQIANQARPLRYWRADGSADAFTSAAARPNGQQASAGIAVQARRRRKTFARDITAQAFTDARAGRLTLSTCAGGRR